MRVRTIHSMFQWSRTQCASVSAEQLGPPANYLLVLLSQQEQQGGYAPFFNVSSNKTEDPPTPSIGFINIPDSYLHQGSRELQSCCNLQRDVCT